MTHEAFDDLIRASYNVEPQSTRKDNWYYEYPGTKKKFASLFLIPGTSTTSMSPVYDLFPPTDGMKLILNLRCDDPSRFSFLNDTTYCKGYRLQSWDWIAICLDGDLKDEEIQKLLQRSYDLAAKAKR
ncbi:MAG: MmcQ/YjbR family DNA-binding protein [Clostridia bacterium]|nr:MmcQ/YjbR family DNA-binding protein [Clostridia bacterium]